MSDSSDPTRTGQDLAARDEAEPTPPTPYDPADYRWVPVRRRPRLDGWTEEKQRRFIEVLADTGLVGHAAREVGMSRESAYRLRRSPHGAAFARAWDAARHHAGGLVEDVAFERAFEGVEHNVYDEVGNVICTKRVYNDRLLMFLLRHLKADRYGAAPAAPPPAPAEAALEATLRAMDPALPAPPEKLLAPDDLADALELADVADGVLPRFLGEQPPPQPDPNSPEARYERGKIAWEKSQRGEKTDDDAEFADICFYLDPVSTMQKGKRRFR